MLATPLPVSTAAEAIRVARALGAHRYVAGRLVLVHAFAFDALAVAGTSPALEEAMGWAREVLGNADIEADSKDERLLRARRRTSSSACSRGSGPRASAEIACTTGS